MKEEDKSNKRNDITLLLDSYNDIFSSFDPRPYSEKSLSDDFIIECKKAAIDKEESKIKLILSVPEEKRKVIDEIKIKKRLSEHFARHFKINKKEIIDIKKKGALWFLIGTALMLIGAFTKSFNGFAFNLLNIMIEPAGWFSFWEGLGKIFITADEKTPNYIFYKKMDKAAIYFISH